MKDISKQYELFLSYYNGELTGNERAAFEKEMEENEELKEAFSDFTLLLRTLKDKESLEMRREFKSLLEKRRKNNTSWIRSIFLNPWSAAAAALFVLIIAVYFLYINLFNDEGSQDQRIMAETTSIDWNHPDFQVLPEYTELLKIEYRSVGFMLLSPHDSLVMHKGEEMKFSWKPSKKKLMIDILDHQGNTVISTDEPVSGPYFQPLILEPGAYLFRIRDHEESLHWGIFFCVP